MTELEAPHSLQHNNLHHHIQIHTDTHTEHALIHLWDLYFLAPDNLNDEKILNFTLS